jgi:hypothetical protein
MTPGRLLPQVTVGDADNEVRLDIPCPPVFT